MEWRFSITEKKNINVSNIHLSIHYLYHLFVRVTAKMKPIPADFGWGCRLPNYRSLLNNKMLYNFAHMHDLSVITALMSCIKTHQHCWNRSLLIRSNTNPAFQTDVLLMSVSFSVCIQTLWGRQHVKSRPSLRPSISTDRRKDIMNRGRCLWAPTVKWASSSCFLFIGMG